MQHNKYILGIIVLSSVFFSLQNANAWVAARGGYGGRGFVAAGHGGYYHGGGCYGCGAAGFAIGAMTGAAVASAARPDTVVVNTPPAVVVQQHAVVVQGNYPLGTQLAQLPAGARNMTVNGVNYYQSGSVWFKPYFGSSGVYYEVVPAP